MQLRPWALLFSLATSRTVAATVEKCFPDSFLFGSATAAYQVEGGWNATGRTPSIWDDFCRADPRREHLQCANVADDFVHRYKDDIALMVETGLSSFRFSVSWSRAMNWDPATKRMKPNAPGLAFYHDLIDTLRAHNIRPILTLYHWDLPLELQTELTPQGWLNRDLVSHFEQYGELIFTEYGGKVDYWATFNEPCSFVTEGYSISSSPPALPPSPTNAYIATHNVLLAHGRAVQRFRQLKATGEVHTQAQIGIVLNNDFKYPLDPLNPQDVAAAERYMQFFVGWFLQPIVSGEYPAIMRERVGDRLPVFSPEETTMLQGSCDVFMLNHYATNNVVDCASPLSTVPCDTLSIGWERDIGVDASRLPEGARLSSTGPHGEYLCDWFSAYPPGYLEAIRWLHNFNKTMPILLTENGWCGNETIDNQDQVWYYQNYIAQVHTALSGDQIPILGYTAWSFLDNYEWGSYDPRFGLYYVNYTAQTGAKNGYNPKPSDLARIPRTAAKWYAQLAKTKCLTVEATPSEEVSVAGLVGVGTDHSTVSPLMRGSMVVVPVMAVAAAAAIVLRRRRRRRPGTRGESAPLVPP